VKTSKQYQYMFHTQGGVMLKITAIFILMTSLSVFACDIDGQTGFLPENDLQVAIGDKNANDMTEERFNEIIDLADKHYKSIIKSKGGKLKWNRNWKSNTVNASAQQSWGTWKVNMYGGLARHELVTDDAFALVVCHELGHHLGGAPRKGARWASNEGQSDYWGSMKCFRRIFESDDNIAIVSQMTIPQVVTDKCKASWSDANSIALCERASMAGKSLGMLLGSLRGNTNIDFDTPSQNEVGSTNDNHPAAQCRLDTYFAGALCDKHLTEDVDSNDATIGVCNRIENYTDGVRPLCWYKPQA
jgi:hypothetical protein